MCVVCVAMAGSIAPHELHTFINTRQFGRLHGPRDEPAVLMQLHAARRMHLKHRERLCIDALASMGASSLPSSSPLSSLSTVSDELAHVAASSASSSQ